MAIHTGRLRAVLSALVAVLLVTTPRTYASDAAHSISAVAVDPLTSSTIYAGTEDAGVYKTTDAGETWTAIGPELEHVQAVVVDQATPTTLYAAVGSHGVFRTTDAGLTWTSIGRSYWWVPWLAVDPQNGALYATVAEAGVFRWDPNDRQWVEILAVQWLPGDFAALQALAIQAPAIYAGAFYATYEAAGVAVYKTLGGGWIAGSAELNTYPAMAGVSVEALAIDPTNPSVLYAAVLNDGLFKSADGGITWHRTSLPADVRQIAIDPEHPDTLYAGLTSGLMKSVDGGSNWTPADRGLTEALLAVGVSPAIPALAVDPRTPNTLYAGTAIGVFETTDGGSHWTRSWR